MRKAHRDTSKHKKHWNYTTAI